MENTTDIIYRGETFILPMNLQYNEKKITCWLPLKNGEPSNKKIKTGTGLEIRIPQVSRGNYYQSNGGESVHVLMHKRARGEPVMSLDDIWAYHYSHLCHNWWCCNPDHIEREPDWVNILRKSDTGVDNNCICVKVSHPLLVNKPKPCIWFNSKTRKSINFSDELIESWINFSQSDQNRFKNFVLSKGEIIKILKEYSVIPLCFRLVKAA